MNFQELMGMARDPNTLEKPMSFKEWWRLTPDQLKKRDDEAKGTTERVTRKILSKYNPPGMMIVAQTSKLAKKGVEAYAQSLLAEGMDEKDIWESSFDKFGQGAYYDRLDDAWKIMVPTPDAKFNKETSFVDDGPKTTVRRWNNRTLEEIIKGIPGLSEDKDMGKMRVQNVEAGRGVEEYGAFDPKANKIVKAEGPTQKDAFKVLMHEMQHGYQGKHGHAKGTSPEAHRMLPEDIKESQKNLKTAMAGTEWLQYKDRHGIADGQETIRQWNDFQIGYEAIAGALPTGDIKDAKRKHYNALASAEKRIRHTLERAKNPELAYSRAGGEGDARYTMNTHKWDADKHRANFIKDKYEENTEPYPVKFEDRYRQLTQDEYAGNEEVWESVGKKKPNKKVGVSGLAPGLIGEKWKPPQSKIFDMVGLDDPSRFIKTEQIAPERYRPARGVPKDILPAGHKKNMDRVAGLLEDGIQKGGLSWYNLRPLRDEYLNMWGEEEGAKRFKNFAEIFAAGSPRSKVIQNNKRTSMFQKLKEDGVDISKVLNAGKTPTPQQFNEGYTTMPQGYGDFAHGLHVPIIGDVESGVGLAGGEKFGRPKVSTFGQNLQGNLAGSTVDTHNKQALTLPLSLNVAVKDNEYGFLDDLNKKQAARHGIQPAQAQASLWQGASEITGVDDSRPLMQILDERIHATADKMSISPQAMRDGLIKGKLPLLQLLPLQKILKEFKPRQPYQQAPMGGGLNMMRYGSGS